MDNQVKNPAHQSNRILLVPPAPKYPGSLGDRAILFSVEKRNTDLLVGDPTNVFWQDLSFENYIGINGIDVKKYDEVHFYPTDVIDGAFGSEPIELFKKVSTVFSEKGKKIFFRCFSYGPNPTKQSRDYLTAVNAMFSLRDELSLERFRGFFPAKSCRLEPDPAFNLELKKPEIELNIPERCVGICPANNDDEKYSMLIERLLQKHYRPVIILHDLRPETGDASLCADLSNKYDISVLPTKDPREIKYYLSKMSFVVTGRMHVAIEAMGACTKVYGFDYNHKMKGTFKIRNQEHRVIERVDQIDEV